MSRYIVKRLLTMVAVLLVTIVVIFTLMYFAPGDPALIMLGQSATPELVEALNEEYGFNDPYFTKLGKYLVGLSQGDMGISFKSRTPVLTELLARYPVTLKIAFGGMTIGIIFGLLAGIVSAVKQYSFFDRILTFISLFGASAPSFWIAMMFVLIFALQLGWFPATGSYTAAHWVLPLATIGLQASASITRMTRSSMLEVLRQDYMRTARSKGQSEFAIVMKHGLRNAFIPILTTAGIQINGYLGGSVLVESVFALPGIGKYILDSVSYQDYNVVQGGTILICASCVIITFIVDMLYAVVDPRIKIEYQKKSVKMKDIKIAKMEEGS